MQLRKIVLILFSSAFAVLGMRLLLSGLERSVEAQGKGMISFAAIPGEKGSQDVTGPYEVVPDWPKPLSKLPGHEKWTWGAVESVFALDDEPADGVAHGAHGMQRGAQARKHPRERPRLAVVPAVDDEGDAASAGLHPRSQPLEAGAHSASPRVSPNRCAARGG